ncbi:MAG: c-type cytochrome [Candidatus Acidiferrales bacterium]
MIGWNKGTFLQVARAFGMLALFTLLATAGSRIAAQEAPKPWVAPEDARKVKNPVPPTKENVDAGAQTYMDNCLLCHGEKGMGDGPGATALKVKPANFTDKKLMSAETDGSLFWKMTQGRGPMPSWKDVLSDTERWQLVDYIRTLIKTAAEK